MMLDWEKKLIALIERHDELAFEMSERGYNHKSPLVDVPDFSLIYPEYYQMLVDVQYSYNDLKLRCKECELRLAR